MKKQDEEPQPRGFVTSAHFEALRIIRREQPELYMTMSRSVKAQVELYSLWRNRHKKKRQAAARDKRIQNLGGLCVCCGENIRLALSYDHIIPKSKGGTKQPDNIQLLCLSCNQLKGTGAMCQHQQIARGLIWQNITPAAESQEVA
jgi:hypothetical protein